MIRRRKRRRKEKQSQKKVEGMGRGSRGERRGGGCTIPLGIVLQDLGRIGLE